MKYWKPEFHFSAEQHSKLHLLSECPIYILMVSPTLSDQDVEWFEERAGAAIREAKELIDELYA